MHVYIHAIKLLCLCVCVWERKIEKEREREKKKEKERERKKKEKEKEREKRRRKRKRESLEKRNHHHWFECRQNLDWAFLIINAQLLSICLPPPPPSISSTTKSFTSTAQQHQQLPVEGFLSFGGAWRRRYNFTVFIHSVRVKEETRKKWKLEHGKKIRTVSLKGWTAFFLD